MQELRLQVENRMLAGEPFDDVEDWINELELAPLHKAGLWLLAFTYLSGRRQRREVYSYLAALADDERPEMGPTKMARGPRKVSAIHVRSRR